MTIASATTRAIVEDRMRRALRRRGERGTLRGLRYDDLDDENEDRAATDAAGGGATTSTARPIDFSSNDYLGLARDLGQAELVRRRFAQEQAEAEGRGESPPSLGATGSRLLSGDSPAFRRLERYLGRIHSGGGGGDKFALLCNSGYDANLTVVSSLPCDIILYDEYAHNSLHMGMRLWLSSTTRGGEGVAERLIRSFSHNSVEDLTSQLQQLQRHGLGRRQRQHLSPTDSEYDVGNDDRGDDAVVVVLIESVYSMDGDVAPVREMLDACARYGAAMVVDEAHGLGVYGRRNSSLSSLTTTRSHRQQQRMSHLPGGTGVLAWEGAENHPALLYAVYTFGKAAGCHGAVVVCGSTTTRRYLVNYGYPFVYSTALPFHSLVTIRCAYDTMTGHRGAALRDRLRRLVGAFRSRMDWILALGRMRKCEENCQSVYLLPSTSPIQALVVPGNGPCTEFCRLLLSKSGRGNLGPIQLYPIKSPTVPPGRERVRIILHAHNTPEEVDLLVRLIDATLGDMGYCRGDNVDGDASIRMVQSRL